MQKYFLILGFVLFGTSAFAEQRPSIEGNYRCHEKAVVDGINFLQGFSRVGVKCDIVTLTGSEAGEKIYACQAYVNGRNVSGIYWQRGNSARGQWQTIDHLKLGVAVDAINQNTVQVSVWNSYITLDPHNKTFYCERI